MGFFFLQLTPNDIIYYNLHCIFAENDALFMKSVIDNQILKAVVCEINRSCLHLNLEAKLVGSLKV